MFKLETKEVLKASIANIGRTGARLIRAIQSTGVQVIAHACKHGDVSLANALLDATPKHQRASLVAFLEVYGPFAYLKADKQLAYFKGNAHCKAFIGGDVTQEYVDKLPHWDSMVKPAEPKSVYDALEEVDKLCTRLRKLAVDGKSTVKNPELLDEVVATYNRFVAKQALGDAAENATGENVHFDPLKAVA